LAVGDRVDPLRALAGCLSSFGLGLKALLPFDRLDLRASGNLSLAEGGNAGERSFSGCFPHGDPVLKEQRP